MKWRMLKTILILPGSVVVLIPWLISWISSATAFAGHFLSPSQLQFWIGLGALALGVFLGTWTASLFVMVGKGTPAPWDPPQKLVIRGPYRHVRNPMISSILFMLLGEALVFLSWPIAWWGLFFFAANSIYFPLVEEKGLERRFGGEYVAFKENVPRWLPRLTPWRAPEEKDPSLGDSLGDGG